MTNTAKDRTFYGTRPTDELERQLRSVRDRMERAETNEDWLADAFVEQEIEAALQQRHNERTEPVKDYRLRSIETSGWAP